MFEENSICKFHHGIGAKMMTITYKGSKFYSRSLWRIKDAIVVLLFAFVKELDFECYLLLIQISQIKYSFWKHPLALNTLPVPCMDKITDKINFDKRIQHKKSLKTFLPAVFVVRGLDRTFLLNARIIKVRRCSQILLYICCTSSNYLNYCSPSLCKLFSFHSILSIPWILFCWNLLSFCVIRDSRHQPRQKSQCFQNTHQRPFCSSL